MITLIFISIGMTLTSFVVSKNNLWPVTILQSAFLSIAAIALINNHWISKWHNFINSVDSMQLPLLVLSCWLTPLALIASKGHLNNLPITNQRTFIVLVIIITTSLIITFSSLELILFYIAFETTLVPTLILITRWGALMERFQAGLYFIFYTLFGSLPLLISLIALYFSSNSLSIPNVELVWLTTNSSTSLTVWWLLSILAFLVKMPIYGFHLWLPKAHVEAPVAGSMILAAILLKLGGYGLMRLISLFSTTSLNFSSLPLVVFCCWGALVTSIICIRQTDLKALIAYSSVGHMSIVAAGVFSQTIWGINGALMLMIAHGLVSSALFALANTMYERSGTRTLVITRGMKLILPLSTFWWLIMCAANLGFPYSNLIGEILYISWYGWSIWCSYFSNYNCVWGVYSLMIFQVSQQGPSSHFLLNVPTSFSREHLLFLLHLLPLLLIIPTPNLVLISWLK
uniref:NADH-ubiquinone oxidoreductase chain 4 n=1 Tax=Arbacia lixula TaxID=7640 RepID=NU4M_ARBLI|nr:RecName: Full=NADH-ubiquinone oxidoreductase chain 4; AltName: Full=NADH dehydrogenase subunit 4 [Arbacia lixula]AAA98046.1 ND4 [Arbacia lixula]